MHVFKEDNVCKNSPDLFMLKGKAFETKKYLKFRRDEVEVKIDIIFGDCLNMNKEMKQNRAAA